MQIVQTLLDGPLFMDVEQLTRVQNGGVGLPALFYAEAGCLVGFLVGDFGTDRFSDFCRGLRKMPADGDWMVVLKQVYQFKDLSELNAAWVKRLKSR